RAKRHPRQRGSIRHDPIQDGLHRIDGRLEPPLKGWRRRRLPKRAKSSLFWRLIVIASPPAMPQTRYVQALCAAICSKEPLYAHSQSC
ncbi:MAG: hypothetical protein WBV79_13965, partial [Rhodomicrobium sp.]